MNVVHLARLKFGAIFLAAFGGVVSGAEYHVSPGGLDNNAGDAAQPFATIEHAVATAKAGDTIWLQTGIYRESIDIKTPGTEPLTIAAAPGEKPQIFGSVALSNWQDSHNTAFNLGGGSVPPGQSVCTTQLPQGASPTGQLFIDDQPALIEKGPIPNSLGYVVQTDAKFPEHSPILAVRLADGDRAAKHRFEWAGAHMVIVSESSACPVHLKDLDIAFANNGKQEGMVNLCSPGSTVENCIVRDSTGRGISIVENGTVERCHVYAHGILGIGSAGGDAEGVKGMRVVDCEIDHNAWNNADTGWEAGGVKLSSARDAVVTGNRIHDNAAWGVWFDWQCVGNRIEGNLCQRNVAGGIFLEASRGRNIITNNICTDTRQDPHTDWGDGIFSHDSSDALVAHNLCLHNAAFGIRFRLDSDRKLADGRRMECAHNVIVNNICAGNGVGQLGLPSDAPLMHGNVSDGNVLFVEGTTVRFAQACNYPALPFYDFAAWQKLGFDRHSIAIQPQFRDVAHADFHPAAKAPQTALDPALVEVPTDFDGRLRAWPVTTAGPFEASGNQ
jgi:parallel beta-helix repeat protein